MGKGSYLGGSTIISPYKRRNSDDGWEPVSVPIKRARRVPQISDKLLSKYARLCGTWAKKGTPWQEAPTHLIAHFEGDQNKLKQAVLSHPAYDKSLNGKNAATKTLTQKRSKQVLRKKSRIKQTLHRHAKACAKADFEGKKRPNIPEPITEQFNDVDIKEWISKVHFLEPYQLIMRRLIKGRRSQNQSNK